ncbi:DNA primase [Microbacterium sp. STN6]|uniref:DNA primase n=1 Tax=Microbacterium sp. STN6 TaxID=2995588 RepID=UPI00226096A2|nr:DNA primase [Microbacterium sp. STN6]MCX7522330.1 DNA primase [Microbacterium sp. STN6]
MAGRIRQSDVEEVKARTNIGDIVGDYVSLRSAGVGSLKGLCPFHDERSPSFHVRPQVGFYHCFGCGESGDVYTFLQKMDHVTFAEAVERLAAKIGYALTYEDGGPAEDRGNRARLIAANAAAAEFFVDALGGGEAEIGRRFLGERGFDRDAADRFGVGFAPKSWDALTNHLKGRGFSAEELAASGLVSTGDRGAYDRFRGRLVWPIRDVTGQTIGFGARRLTDDDKGPKYLNTPETPIYHKAQVLYGLDLAKRDISRTHRVVVVEGYTDVMACHLAGITTAVATCGTAFGADHITVLRRVLGDDSGEGEVVFTFDPDAAGQKAAMRAFAEERRFSAQTYVAVGPEGLDPCDLRLAHGDGAVRSMIENKKPMFEFMIRQVLGRFDLDTVEGRVSALRTAAPLVAEIRDASLRPGYTRELARMLGVDLAEVTRAVAGGARRADAAGTRTRTPEHGAAQARGGRSSDGAPSGGDAASVAAPPPASIVTLPVDPATRLERDALQALVQHPTLVGRDLAARAVRSGMTNPALAVVRDAMAGALDALEAADWISRIIAEAPAPFTGLVQELAVAPIPERSERELTMYARGVVSGLIDKDLLHRKAELLGRLQRADSADAAAYRAIQQELLAVETERRRLREE